MKYLLKLLLIAGLFTPTFAQDDDVTAGEDPKARARIEAARAAYITERLDLTPQEAEKFWPLYGEFADKRKALIRQYREAKRSGKSEEELITLQLKLKQDELDLEKSYSDQFLKVIPAQKLVNLRNAERDFSRLVMKQLQKRQMHRDSRQQFRDGTRMRR